ncbi:MAG TPA: NAD(P)-binding protein [Terriglobia bacterium]|jgi:choline dehydrogenase-like flavoprotein
MLIPIPDSVSTDSLHPTVCIIGAGPAGITLACELDGEPFDVLLLEAGETGVSGGSPEDYRGTAENPHPNPAEFRRFCLGGSSSVWGGRCVPYDPIDFERRDYVSNSGWPLSFADVAKHYPRAMEYCDAGRFDFSTNGSIARPAATIPGLAQHRDLQTDCIERYSLPTHFGARYRKKLQTSRNVTTMLQSRCIAINKRQGDDLVESIV